MSESSFTQLFQHMWWADDLALEALRRSKGEPVRALEIFAHVLGAELIWLDRIEGAKQSVPVWPEPTLEACERLAQRAKDRYTKFLDTLTPEALRGEAHYTNSAGLEFDSSVADILTHVALHGMYHRGQVALLQRDAGVAPNPTDFIAFVRGVPAATRRPRE